MKKPDQKKITELGNLLNEKLNGDGIPLASAKTGFVLIIFPISGGQAMPMEYAANISATDVLKVLDEAVKVKLGINQVN